MPPWSRVRLNKHMGLAVSNMSLTLSLAEALREIQTELFSGPAPQCLHHYTRAAALESIIGGRAIWATCIADQADQAEISYTAAIMTQFADGFSHSEGTDFARDVLNRLPFFMEERKCWMFIACFCDDDDSALHWKQYGDYRLTFPAPWTNMPSLTLGDHQAECWYQRVIYDEAAQRSAVERALRAPGMQRNYCWAWPRGLSTVRIMGSESGESFAHRGSAATIPLPLGSMRTSA